jgi:hypothetical protein
VSSISSAICSIKSCRIKLSSRSIIDRHRSNFEAKPDVVQENPQCAARGCEIPEIHCV